MGDGIVGGSYRGRRIMGRGPYRVGRMVSCWEDGIVWGGWYRGRMVSWAGAIVGSYRGEDGIVRWWYREKAVS